MIRESCHEVQVHSSALAVMAFNRKGRFYERGKGLSEELKGQIIDKILETGGRIGYRDTFLESGRNLAINLVFLERPLKTYGKSLYMMVRLVPTKESRGIHRN